MKLFRIGLAVLTSLLLTVSVCPSAQATESAEVDLNATVPLIISAVSASGIGYYSATISWNTNGDATSQVFYDVESRTKAEDYTYRTDEEPTPVIEHTVNLSGLASSTTYHFRVRSAVNGFEAISPDYDFTTSTPAAVGGGGFGPAIYYLDTDLFGIEKSYRMSYDGELRQTIEAASADGMLTITIPKGTIALDKDGKRLASLTSDINESPPDPPEDAYIIGLAYEFGPDGATFDPAITLTWSYDPDALPEGVVEEDLVIAYYDKEVEKWIKLDSIVDTEANTISAKVSHFTAFAVFGYKMVVPPVVPAAFTVSQLTISPSEVYISEMITISVIVANTGGESGSYEVALKINGVAEATKEVIVNAGFSKEVTFSISKDVAGTYAVTIDGLTGSFMVKEEVVPPVVPKPINWRLIGGIIAAVVVIGLLVYFLVFRRRRAS